MPDVRRRHDLNADPQPVPAERREFFRMVIFDHGGPSAVARKIGSTRKTVEKWYAGTRWPSEAMAEALAAALPGHTPQSFLR